MSDTGDLSSMDELEPTAPQAEESGPAQPAVMPVAVTTGLPAPAYNPAADKEYYRFLFAGVIMLLGCLMPFGPDLALVGYKTPGGAFAMIIALGIVWSSWASIHHRRVIKGLMRWIGLAFVVFVVGILDLTSAFEAPAVRGYVSKAEANAAVIRSVREEHLKHLASVNVELTKAGKDLTRINARLKDTGLPTAEVEEVKAEVEEAKSKKASLEGAKAAAEEILAQNPAREGVIKSWGDFFGQLNTILYPNSEIGEFLRHYGTGRLGVFFGALLAELFLILAIFGGAKKIKEQKTQRSTGRRRR